VLKYYTGKTSKSFKLKFLFTWRKRWWVLQKL